MPGLQGGNRRNTATRFVPVALVTEWAIERSGYAGHGHFIPVGARNIQTIMIGMRRDTLPMAHACRADAEARVSSRGRAAVGGLFAEVLQCDLDTLVVHLLEIGLKLFAALRAAMEEFGGVRMGVRGWSSASITVVDPRSMRPSRS